MGIHPEETGAWKNERVGSCAIPESSSSSASSWADAESSIGLVGMGSEAEAVLRELDQNLKRAEEIGFPPPYAVEDPDADSARHLLAASPEGWSREVRSGGLRTDSGKGDELELGERGASTSNGGRGNGGLHSSIPFDADTRYFKDGMRRIDFVLVYKKDSKDLAEETKKANKRKEFEGNLTMDGGHDDSNAKCALDLEREGPEESTDEETYYIKIHAPWNSLAHKAEQLKIKMPIKKNDPGKYSGHGCVEFLSGLKPVRGFMGFLSRFNIFELKNSEIPKEEDYVMAPFAMDRMSQFVMPADRDEFWTPSQRARMVWDILIRTRYDRNNDQRIGIARLLRKDVYTAAFPLHEGSTSTEDTEEEKSQRARDGRKNDRQLLYENWAKPSMFYKNQPMDLIKKYFGEKIALYFAWLAFYTKALIPAALIGTICVIYGLGTIHTDVPTEEVCHGEVGDQWLCPACDHGCDFTQVNANCGFARATHVFDNIFTVIFAVVMSIWATTFLEGWKRKHAEIAFHWDLSDFSPEEAPIRPDYQSRAPTTHINPITNKKEPNFPHTDIFRRITCSAVAVVFFLCLVLAFVFGVILYRVVVVHVMLSNSIRTSIANYATSFSAAFINLVIILLLNYVYKTMAYRLTVWEYPRTQMEFENSYTLKVFLFQFVNFYSSLFYIAFFKGKFIALPGAVDQANLLGYPPEQCNPAGCMTELLIQLAVIMVGKQFLNNAMEIIFPIVLNWWRSRKSTNQAKEQNNPITRWEKDLYLTEVPELFLFDEYLEMVLQYGFITLFVAAFPLAPLMALLNNIIEVRLDAYKFVVAYRRPTPERVKDLGVWYLILDAISKKRTMKPELKACVIAFTSDFVPRLLYSIYPHVGDQEGSLQGYFNWTLAYYVPDNNSIEMAKMAAQHNPVITYCRFKEFRAPPCQLAGSFGINSTNCTTNYSYTFTYWHVLAAKLAFILIFEHLVFFVKGMVSYFIPDIPHQITVQMQKEHYLARQAQFDALTKRQESKRLSGDLEANNSYTFTHSPDYQAPPIPPQT